MAEAELLKQFLVAHSKHGSRLFRNNVGLAWTGSKKIKFNQVTTITANAGDILIRDARPFRGGFPKGASDLIGFTQITIDSTMVGRSFAVFTAVEAKTEVGKPSREQLAFIRAVNKLGGIAMVARKIEDIYDTVNKFISGDSFEAKH